MKDYKEDALKKLTTLADKGELDAIEFCIEENVDKQKYLDMLYDIMNKASGEGYQIQAAKKLYKLVGDMDTNTEKYYSGIVDQCLYRNL